MLVMDHSGLEYFRSLHEDDVVIALHYCKLVPRLFKSDVYRGSGTLDFGHYVILNRSHF